MKLVLADSGQFSLRKLPVLGLFMSHDAVQKRLSANEASQILQEVTNQRFGFANVSSCHMRGNEAIWFRPKRVIVRQRLRLGHVQPGGLEVSRPQSVRQGLLIDRRAPPNIVENRARFDGRKAAGIEKVARLRAVWKDVDDVVGRLERANELVFRDDRDGFIAPGLSAIGDDLHIKRAEQFGQPPANRAKTDNQNRFPPQRRRGATKRVPGVTAVGSPALKGAREISGLGQHEAQDVDSARLVEDARTVGHGDFAFRHERTKGRVVIARNARRADVNPLELTCFRNGLRVGLAKSDVRRGQLRVVCRGTQDGGRRGSGKKQLLPLGSFPQQFQRIGRRGKVHIDSQIVHGVGYLSPFQEQGQPIRLDGVAVSRRKRVAARSSCVLTIRQIPLVILPARLKFTRNENCESVKSLDPPDTFHLSAALGWLELGNWQEASEELEKITPALRVHPEVLEVRFQVYAAAKKWDLAAEIATTLVQIRPNDPQLWISHAYAARRMPDGGIPQAKGILHKAQQLFPKEPLIAYNLACYECQLGDLKAAWKWLGIAFDLGNPKRMKLMALKDPDLEPLWAEIGGI